MKSAAAGPGARVEASGAAFSEWILRMEYRVYEIGDGDHIVGSTPLVCKDDDEAMAKARELAPGTAHHRGLEG